MWGLLDSEYKNTSIHDGLTWSEIIPKKKSLINKNGGEGDLVIAFIEGHEILLVHDSEIRGAQYWYLFLSSEGQRC